jgi:putative transposase
LCLNTLFIELGSPWENGYIQSFNGKMRDELLNREISFTLIEAKTLIGVGERSTITSEHRVLGYRPHSPPSLDAGSTECQCSRTIITIGTF